MFVAAVSIPPTPFFGNIISRRKSNIRCRRVGVASPALAFLQQERGAAICGVDVDSAKSAKGTPDHIVFMVNGLNGSPQNWNFVAKQFTAKLPNNVIVHRSGCNTARLTYDGVDLMGDRLADEVRTVVSRGDIHKISFVAHSLGGLVARYAIGRLYEPKNSTQPSVVSESYSLKEDISGGRIAGLCPMNFITIASPHLGSRGHKQFPFLFGLPFLEQTASKLAHLFIGRTGKHLFLTDNDDGRPPLLLRMTYDSEIKFRSALRAFKRRVAYANTDFDRWGTSSIRRPHELPKPLILENKKYMHIINIDRTIHAMKSNELPEELVASEHDFEEKMVKGLNQVSWERIDVSFQKSLQRIVAHNTIQVNTFLLNSDGAEVVYHLIDNFLL